MVPSGPENVPSLTDYLPNAKKYEVSLSFTGEAAKAIDDLMDSLEVDSANEVAKRAIALLLSAQGKEILLKDRNGKIQAVVV